MSRFVGVTAWKLDRQQPAKRRPSNIGAHRSKSRPISIIGLMICALRDSNKGGAMPKVTCPKCGAKFKLKYAVRKPQEGEEENTAVVKAVCPNTSCRENLTYKESEVNNER